MFVMTLTIDTKAFIPGGASDDTKLRLLNAAGEVFAEQGFEKATVRDICARAGANIAAVNYHFGGKDKLYNAAVLYWQPEALEKHPPLLGLTDAAPAEERLKAFVHSILRRMFDPGRPSWHGKLMAREMIAPTSASELKCVEYVRPLTEILGRILRDLIGPNATDETVRQSVCSVVGQCVFFFHHRPLLDRVMPQQQFEPESVERLADHIVAFSLAGLRGISASTSGNTHE